MIKSAQAKKLALNLLSGNWGWVILISLVTTLFATVFTFLTLSATGLGFLLPFGFQVYNPIFTGFTVVGTILMFIICLLVNWLVSILGNSILISLFKLDQYDEKLPVVNGALSSLDGDYFIPLLLTTLIKHIYITLWYILLVIPGIIKSYAYSMTEFIVIDERSKGNQIGYNEAISRSRILMRGHKWQLFLFDLSFIGWFILAGIFGILDLGVRPYFLASRLQFYKSLLEQAD
ncbi:MAG: DUF975 family protein [Lactobacillus sp.]|nr:DUF975 family protein [Lactobacillus sp.]